jgi:hypothetical protein
MRTTLIASLFALAGLMAAAPSQAMPFAPAGEAGVSATLVAYGCGAGFTRGPHGHCHPIGGPRPYAHHPYARHCWWHNGVRVCR